MSKISRTEYLNNIRNIINESVVEMTGDYSGSDQFNISRYIAALIEEGQREPGLMDFLLRWQNITNECGPENEYKYYRPFANELTKFSKTNMSVRKVLNEIQGTLDAHSAELDMYCLIDMLDNAYAQESVREAYNEYLLEPSDLTRQEVLDAIMTAYESGDSVAERIMALFSDSTLSDSRIQYMVAEGVDNFAENNRKIAKAREERKVRKIQEKLEEYANSLFEAAEAQREQEREMYSLAGIANNNGLKLTEAIKTIAGSDASKNKKLMETVDQYAGAIRSGLYEERLYETFVTNLTPFNYLKPVEKVLNDINEAARKNAVAITLTKLMEEMSESASYQLLPLIEEAVARYVKNPNPNNRVQARQCLIQFSHDPYCYAILEAIDRDDSKAAMTLSEQVMTIKDTAKLVREKASTTSLYSPVQYIKEGECVFNASGTYFVKKHNAITKLDTDHVNMLSEKFVTLCKLVNDPAVQILEDKIILRGNDKIAEIYVGYADINKTRESRESLRNLQEMCCKYDFDTNFFIMCSCLLENFDNIAKINFGTHIALNSNPGVNVDMFRLGDNIFINTVNEDLMSSTFFQNVNPLQCKNIINGHMGINVASLFENLLPDQSKILMRLNETQEEYVNSINKLETTIDKLEAGKKKCSDKASIEKLDANIKKAKDQLEEVKTEYKKWQEKVGKETGEAVDDDADDEEVNGDGETRQETTSEPLDDKEVEANMEDLTTPIEGGATEATAGSEPAEGEDDPFTLSDDEFESFLSDDEAGDEALGTDEPAADDEDPDLTDEINNIIDAELGDEATEEPVADEAPADDIISIEGETAGDEVLGDENTVEDGGFDELPVADEIITEPAAEDVPSDEDVITDVPADEPEATDMFGGDTEDPIGMEAGAQYELSDEEKDAVTSHSDIAAVMFDENIKTGEKYRSGYVSVITPMVTGTGDLYNDMKNYKFYIDAEGNPVIDGDAMSAALYNGIIDKIKSEPLYDIFVKEGVDKAEGTEKNAKVITVPNADQPVTEDPEDTDEYFTTTDLPDEFSVELDFVDPVDDEPEAEAQSPADFVENEPAEEETLDFNTNDEVPFIPTYKSGDTEIELPAPGVDGSVIPESKETPKKKTVNEARKAIKGIKSVLNKPGKDSRFFVNEDSGKSSKVKRHSNNALSEDIAGVTGNDDFLIRDINEPVSISSLSDIHEYAVKIAAEAGQKSGHRIQVTGIEAYLNDEESLKYDKPYYFVIKNNDDAYKKPSMAVYTVSNKVYMRPYTEFIDICKDFEDEVPLQLACALEYEYTTDSPLTPLDTNNPEDMKFALRAHIAYMVDEPVANLELNERCKIRKVKLSPGGDYLKSKQCDDILHGDEEERDFKEDVEKQTQAAGVDNPLAPAQPAQEEAYVPVLPNVHRVKELMENYDIVFEANDRVLYNNVAAEVISVSEDEKTASIKFKDGSTKKVAMTALEPDPEYVNDLNVQDTDKSLIKDSEPEGKDLDAHTIECDIVVDGHKINIGECWANIQDIKDSKRAIRVLNEEGFVQEFDIVDNLKFDEWPYAVVIDHAGEPIRKIQINPQVYVEAGPDDLVDCICGGKETAFPKRVINILT